MTKRNKERGRLTIATSALGQVGHHQRRTSLTSIVTLHEVRSRKCRNLSLQIPKVTPADVSKTTPASTRLLRLLGRAESALGSIGLYRTSLDGVHYFGAQPIESGLHN